ncbi:pilus assembly protein PilZ [Anopheles sinensis]|uniref:Pilus assembly protein PilZ n=1 Tax=Anopheles sinensis TaxID=74873 RepID=A0A084WDE7_ANOSI|nr:pilus assembly protein PilZ [Anopheles sinensis]
MAHWRRLAGEEEIFQKCLGNARRGYPLVLSSDVKASFRAATPIGDDRNVTPPLPTLPPVEARGGRMWKNCCLIARTIGRSIPGGMAEKGKGGE